MIDFAAIFGVDSSGDTPESRAASSSRTFVRSHFQLALDTENATGRRLTASEALDIFGLSVLSDVAEEGGVGIVTDAEEPAKTLAERRRILRLSKRGLATAAGVTVDEINAAETPGIALPIRQLEKITQALALDERRIGLADAGRGDRNLVTRLRELRNTEERDDSFITNITEAAWVIERQSELSAKLHADHDRKSKFLVKSGDYAHPVWRKGYELAERTREILEIDPMSPIRSVYALAQDALGIPVVDTTLEENVAGATILNGTSSGIALNTSGANRNILIRRMTLAHELGHLLWDPANQLESVRVDESSDLNRRDLRDPVEARANAFAVALLAPRAAVKDIFDQQGELNQAIAVVVEKFGISASAAANHMANVCNLPAQSISGYRNAGMYVTRTWEQNEVQDNLITSHVPSSRGARFALLTLQAVRRKFISIDTASSWLKIDKRLLTDLF